MTTQPVNPDTLLLDGFILRKCRACGGSGSIMIMPNDTQPVIENPCEACKSTGYVRIRLGDIPIMEIGRAPHV
jgi:DnaJ-class molecular chaperone